MTHSLGFSIAATALFAAGPSTALGQSPAAPAQEPSRPSSPSAAEGEKSTFILNLRPSGIEMTCIGCRGFDTTVVRPESTSSTAPWVLQGKWRRQTALGAVSTGFLGTRNYGLPLLAATPFGRDFDPAAVTSGASVDSGVSQWSFTAGVDKTLVTHRSGASVGVTGDVLVPVKTETPGIGDPRATVLESPTIRVGIVLRW